MEHYNNVCLHQGTRDYSLIPLQSVYFSIHIDTVIMAEVSTFQSLQTAGGDYKDVL